MQYTPPSQDEEKPSLNVKLNSEIKIKKVASFIDKETLRLALLSDCAVEIHDFKETRNKNDEKNAGSTKITLPEEMSIIESGAFSSDGKCLLLGYNDGGLRMHNLEKGISFHKKEHDGAVLAVALSPNKEIISSGGTDETIIIYRFADGLILNRLCQLGGEINSINFSPDSGLIAFTGGMPMVHIYKTTSGFPILKNIETQSKNCKIDFSKNMQECLLFVGETGKISSYKISHEKTEPKCYMIPDKKIKYLSTYPFNDKVLFISKCLEKGLYSINTLTPEVDEEPKTLIEHKQDAKQKLMTLCVSPNNYYIATGSSDGYLRLFNLENGKQILWRKLFNNSIPCINFSTNGTKIIAGSNKKVNIIDLNGKKLAIIETNEIVRSAIFTPSDKYIMLGLEGDKGGLFIFQIDYNKKEDENSKQIYLNKCHRGEQILGLDYAFDGSKFVSASADKTVLLHQVRKQNKKKLTETEKILVHENTARTVNFSPDGKFILSGGYDSKVFFIDLVTKVKKCFSFRNEGEIRVVAFSPSSPQGIAAYSDGEVFLFSIPSGAILLSLPIIKEGPLSELRGAAFSKDGSKLIIGNESGFIEVHDIVLKERAIKYSTHSDTIRCIAISPAGDKYATAGDGKEIKIFHSQTHVEINIIPQQEWVNCMVFSPDGIKLLVAGGGIDMMLFDIFSGILIQKYKGPSEWIPAIAFSPNQIYVLSGSTDKFVRLYKTRSGKLLDVFPHPENDYELNELFAASNKKTSTKKTFITNDQAMGKMEISMDLVKSSRGSSGSAILGSIYAVAFTKDSSSILIGGDDDENKLSKLDLVKKSFIKYEGHENTVRAIAIFKTLHYFASGDDDGRIIVYDYKTNKKLFQYEHEVEISINTITVSHNDETLAIGSDDCMIKVFYLYSDGYLLKKREFKGGDGEDNIYSTAFLSKEKLLISKRNKLKIYDVMSNKFEPPIANKATSVEINHTGTFVAFAGKQIDIFNFKTGLIYKKISVLSLLLKSEREKLKDRSDDAAQSNLKNKENDEESEERKQNKIKQNKIIYKVSKIKFGKSAFPNHPENDDFILVLLNFKILLFDFKSHEPYKDPEFNIARFEDVEEIGFSTINFSINNDYIYAGNLQGSLSTMRLELPLSRNIKKINRSSKSRLLGKFHATEVIEIYNVCVKDNLNCLLSGSRDGKIVLMNLADNNNIYSFSPHKDMLNSLKLSQDMQMFITASSDKSIKVFESATGSQIKSFTNQQEKVMCADFSSNSDFVFACDAKYSVIIFDMNSEREFDRIHGTSIEEYLTLVASPNNDSIALATKNGPRIFHGLLNTRNRLARFQSLHPLDTSALNNITEAEYWKAQYEQYQSFKFEIEDLYIFPYPIRFNKVHHMIMKLGIELSLDRVHIYYMKGTQDENPGLIENALLAINSLGITPWEYWLENNNSTLQKLVDIFLHKKLPNIHKMAGKGRIIEKIALERANYISKSFEFFTTKIRGVELPIITKATNIESFSCHPSSVSLKSLFINHELFIKKVSKKKSDSRKVKKVKHLKPKFFVSFCLIKPYDLMHHLDVFSSLPLSHQIYKVQPFLDLVEYQWNKTGFKDFFFDALLYTCLLSIITINCIIIYPTRTSFKEESMFYNMLAFSLDIFIILILVLHHARNEIKDLKRIYQPTLLKKLRIHFSGLWNKLDMALIVLGITFCFVDILEIWTVFDDSDSLALKVICSTFFFVSWIRFLDFARGMETSATLVRVIAQSFFDIRGFLMTIMFILVGMCFSTYLIQMDYDTYSHWEFLKIFYYVLVGDYSDFKNINNLIDNNLSFFTLLVTTFCLIFVMLTLLIAIISESFKKVMTFVREATAYERLQNIYERASKYGFQKGNQNYIYKVRTELSKIDKLGQSKKKKMLKLDQQYLDIKRSLSQMTKMLEIQFFDLKLKSASLEEGLKKAADPV